MCLPPPILCPTPTHSPPRWPRMLFRQQIYFYECTQYIKVASKVNEKQGLTTKMTPHNDECSWVKSLVTGHFVPRSFRTQVISYHFGHFVPTFFNLVISYPVWSFRTHFVPNLVISYLLLLFSGKPFWWFRTNFLLFRTQVISYPKSFRTHFSHFIPRPFRTHF